MLTPPFPTQELPNPNTDLNAMGEDNWTIQALVNDLRSKPDLRKQVMGLWNSHKEPEAAAAAPTSPTQMRSRVEKLEAEAKRLKAEAERLKAMLESDGGTSELEVEVQSGGVQSGGVQTGGVQTGGVQEDTIYYRLPPAEQKSCGKQSDGGYTPESYDRQQSIT